MKEISLLRKCFIISMIMAIFAIGSCTKDSTEDFTINDVEFAISANIPNFGAEDNLSQSFSLAANLSWRLLDTNDDPMYSYADWVSSVSPTSGENECEITITLDANSTVNERSTTLYFGLPKFPSYDPIEVTITQDANTSSMSVDRSDIWYMAMSADPADYTQIINITTSSSSAWKLFTEADDEQYAIADWIETITPSGSGSGEITITVEPYEDETYDSRSTFIYIGLDDEESEPKQIKVSQFSKYEHHISSQALIASEGVIYVDQSGTVATPPSFNVITSLPWVIAAADDTGAFGHYSWVKPSVWSGTNNDPLSITCDANTTNQSRESKLWVGLVTSETDVQYYTPFTIIQSGFEGSFSLSEENIEISAAGTSREILVTSTSDWQIDINSQYLKDDPKWLTVSKASAEDGVSGEKITLSATENTSIESRSTQITFTLNDFPEMDPLVYTITQSGTGLDNAAMTLSCSMGTASDTGVTLSVDNESVSSLSYTIYVDSDLDWEITDTGASWVTTSVSENAAGVKTLYVTVKNNRFNSTRNTEIKLCQKYDGTYYGAEKSVTINQAALTTALLSTYRELGYGYDITGKYAHKSSVKRQILDWDKMDSYDIIDPISYGSQTSADYTTEVTTSISEAQTKLSTAAGISASYNGFSAEVRASYSTDLQSYSETEYGKRTGVVNLAEITTATTSYETLRNCLTDEAYTAINSISSEEDADAFIANFGAYVIMGCTYGGTWEYSVSAVRNKSISTSEWSAFVKTGYEATSLNSVSADGEVTYTDYVSNNSYSSYEYVEVNGGGASFSNADEWFKSLTVSGDNSVETVSTVMALIDYGGEDLVSVSTLIDGEISTYLENAIARATTANEIETVTATQSIFSYQFWIGEIFYYGTDSGGDYAEVSLNVESKIIDSTSTDWTSIGGNWVSMWDNTSNEIQVPVNGTYATILQMGTGTITQTNKLSTGDIFTGGAGSYVIGFKIFAEEKDTTDSDDASTTYAYFQTKTGYLGSRIAEKPFYYLYSVNDEGYPQSVIQGYVDLHTLSWTSVAEAIGNGDYRNGYAIVEGVNSSGEHKWRFTIYYRML